jgi:peptide/nickel transport system substrate-binding protein
MKSRFSRRLGFTKRRSFKAENDSIFEIKLIKPFPAFLGLMTMKCLSGPKLYPIMVVSFTYRDRSFQLKLWEENVKLVLRKTLYFMKRRGNALPYLEAVAITFYRISKVVLQFIQGKLDFTSGLDPSYKDDILTQTGELQPKYKDEVNLITGPYLILNI